MNAVCRKDRIYQDGTTPLFLRFTSNRKSRFVSLGVAINPVYWNAERQELTPDCPDGKNLQFRIDSVREEYAKKIHRLEVLEIEATLEALFGTARRSGTTTLNDVFNQAIARLEALGKYGSASKHKAALSLLNQFDPIAIRLEQIDISYLNDFELFLLKRGNKSNSIATKLSILKAIYNKAITEELFVPKSNPFTKFKVGRLWVETRKRAITKEDIQKLIDFELPPDTHFLYLEFARDIFLFSYYMAGINFKDIALLTYSSIHNGRIYYVRRKTTKEMNCHLIEPAQHIVQKYFRVHHQPEDYIFPILNRGTHVTDQQIFNRTHKMLVKVNTHLKWLGLQIGLQTPLTTYVARHTYATVMKKAGVNIALISESLGHSDLATTQIYLDSFENNQIDEAMRHLL